MNSIKYCGLDVHRDTKPAASHIGIYLPDRRIVFAGDEIHGRTLPQIHSLRDTRPRDIERWFTASDIMRSYNAEYLVPGHRHIVVGAARVETMLTSDRNAMQYALNQTIRLINMGYTPDELAETVKF